MNIKNNDGDKTVKIKIFRMLKLRATPLRRILFLIKHYAVKIYRSDNGYIAPSILYLSTK